MFRVDLLLVVLPTWNELELASIWPRTVSHRFQSNIRSTDVVVRAFSVFLYLKPFLNR